jgi:hypothetical protein
VLRSIFSAFLLADNLPAFFLIGLYHCYGQDVSHSRGLLPSEHQPIRRVEIISAKESTEKRAQHPTIIEEVLGDNWNDRVGMSTIL